MAYAASIDLIARFDHRVISDLASDSGEPVADVSTDANVQAGLDDASGRIDAAVTVAQHYTPADLAALTGTDLALLKRLTCELTMLFLFGRRQETLLGQEYERLEKRCEDQLDRLRKGERLFGMEANRNAGLPTIDGPTTTDYRDLYLVRDRVQNFYPQRVLPGLR